MIPQLNAGLKGSSLLNFGFRRGHRWCQSGRRRIMDMRVSIGPASWRFVQKYPSSVLRTSQSFCRALKVFYQTSLLLLCNALCHAYERSLKLLEINNILSISKHGLKVSDKFFHFDLQMDGY